MTQSVLYCLWGLLILGIPDRFGPGFKGKAVRACVRGRGGLLDGLGTANRRDTKELT